MTALLKIPIIGNMLYTLADWRTDEKVTQLSQLIPANAKLVDIGAGNCLVAKKLNRSVTPIDIVDGSFVKDIHPKIFDGKTLPFKNQQFDMALLITVLHHIAHPENTVKEAARVAKKIIIIEEVYSNPIQKHLTYFIDSLFNLEFINHPHTNKTHTEWLNLFSKLGLKVKSSSQQKSLFGLLTRVTYLLSV